VRTYLGGILGASCVVVVTSLNALLFDLPLVSLLV
jgi:hypothetical protein